MQGDTDRLKWAGAVAPPEPLPHNHRSNDITSPRMMRLGYGFHRGPDTNFSPAWWISTQLSALEKQRRRQHLISDLLAEAARLDAAHPLPPAAAHRPSTAGPGPGPPDRERILLVNRPDRPRAALGYVPRAPPAADVDTGGRFRSLTWTLAAARPPPRARPAGMRGAPLVFPPAPAPGRPAAELAAGEDLLPIDTAAAEMARAHRLRATDVTSRKATRLRFGLSAAAAAAGAAAGNASASTDAATPAGSPQEPHARGAGRDPGAIHRLGLLSGPARQRRRPLVGTFDSERSGPGPEVPAQFLAQARAVQRRLPRRAAAALEGVGGDGAAGPALLS